MIERRSMTSTTANSQPSSAARVIGVILMIIGVIMIVSGAIAWGATSSQLKAQQMSVPGDAHSNAGKTVAGPFTAWSMQDTINMHATESLDGETYATLGTKVDEAKEAYGEDSDEAAALQNQRNLAQSASFLRASLFTSVLAFGVSFLVIGTGITAALTGWGFIAVANRRQTAAA